ncbi:MAG: hypothetical protein ACTSQM_05280, partial [Candidatus Odinarchaeia archaeon]
AQWIDAHRDVLIKMVSELAHENEKEIPTRIRRALPYLSESNIRFRIYEKGGFGSNFIGWIGSGKPVLGLISSIYTAPSQSITLTDLDRFRGKGQLHVNHVYGNFASMIMAVKALSECGIKLEGRLVIVGLTGTTLSQTSNLCYLIENRFLSDLDYVVVSGATGLTNINLPHYESIVIKLKVTKVNYVGSIFKKKNIIETLASIILRFREFRDKLPVGKRFMFNCGEIKSKLGENYGPIETEVSIEVYYPSHLSIEKMLKEFSYVLLNEEASRPETSIHLEISSEKPKLDLNKINMPELALYVSINHILGEKPNFTYKDNQIATISGVDLAPTCVFGGDEETYSAEIENLTKSLADTAKIYALSAMMVLNAQ